MPVVRLPRRLTVNTLAHNEWLQVINEAKRVVDEDLDLKAKALKHVRLKGRRLAPEVLGRCYAMYCNLLNKLYDSYLSSIHLQRAAYMKEIIKGIWLRIYELRNELVHVIINDYVYIDQALVQKFLTPQDIEIVVPFHLATECREGSMEQLLRQMWVDAVDRKNAPPPPPPITDEDELLMQVVEEPPKKQQEPSEHTVLSEDYIQVNIIQAAERFRQSFRRALLKNIKLKKTFYKSDVKPAPKALRIRAAKVIQVFYREYMKQKREKIRYLKRQVLLGLLDDPFKDKLDLTEENTKIYEKRRDIRNEIRKTYTEVTEFENERLLFFKKDGQIEDITTSIREWFFDWYYNYGFFPQYPYELEGGTIFVIRGDYPSVEEQIEDDEKYAATHKGKTAEMLKQEKQREKEEAAMKAELAEIAAKKEKEDYFKQRCNPPADPGYAIRASNYVDDISDQIKNYFASWSLYDRFPPDSNPEVLYGFIRPLITEDLMNQMHIDCRMYVDELMRLELKLLVKAHQTMYKKVGLKWPKMRMRPKPKPPKVPKKGLVLDEAVFKKIEGVFDYNLITKPTSKMRDIIGDNNYTAYDFNTEDPYATFPPPGYTDIKRRLILSCVFGAGIEPNAKRNKAVVLVGPDRNGKSFLADCVAGEMNAVKIDISPEVLSSKVARPTKLLTQAFLAARVFQPAVIFLKNIERVFIKKATPETKHLKTTKIKKPLKKLVKAISPEDKVIFIATCSFPKTCKFGQVKKLFSEVLLVPRADYASVYMFLTKKLLTIRSIPRDFCPSAMARMLAGLGFGVIFEMFDRIMTPERIVRLNVTPLSPAEFLEDMIVNDVEPSSVEEYVQDYQEYIINNSYLKAERAEYKLINASRAMVYEKAEERRLKDEKKNEK